MGRTYIEIGSGHDNVCYRISNDGRSIEINIHHTTWCTWKIAPPALKVIELRENAVGTEVECLMSDGYWYGVNIDSFLAMLPSERERKEAIENQGKKTKKTKEKSTHQVAEKTEGPSKNTDWAIKVIFFPFKLIWWCFKYPCIIIWKIIKFIWNLL